MNPALLRNRIPIAVGLLIGSGLLAQLSACLRVKEAGQHSRHLLLDDRVVAQKQNVRLEVGAVKKHEANPLMKEDKPWEPRFDNLYPNIVYDPDSKLYRCWYNPFITDPLVTETPRDRRDLNPFAPEDSPDRQGKVPYLPYDREFGLCYATSQDGLTWTKPELNLVEYQGSKANNLLLRGSHGGGILIDPRDPQPSGVTRCSREECGSRSGNHARRCGFPRTACAGARPSPSPKSRPMPTPTTAPVGSPS